MNRPLSGRELTHGDLTGVTGVRRKEHGLLSLENGHVHSAASKQNDRGQYPAHRVFSQSDACLWLYEVQAGISEINSFKASLS